MNSFLSWLCRDSGPYSGAAEVYTQLHHLPDQPCLLSGQSHPNLFGQGHAGGGTRFSIHHLWMHGSSHVSIHPQGVSPQGGGCRGPPLGWAPWPSERRYLSLIKVGLDFKPVKCPQAISREPSPKPTRGWPARAPRLATRGLRKAHTKLHEACTRLHEAYMRPTRGFPS